MDLLLLLTLSGIIFFVLIWLLEIPALLFRIYKNHDSWKQISGSAKLYISSPIYIAFIGGILMILGVLVAIIVVGLIIVIPISLVVLPIAFIVYRWYQLGDMMLDISEAMDKGVRKRTE